MQVAADPGAGNAVRSSAPSITTLRPVKSLQQQKRITGGAARQKKDSLKSPTAVAVIIVIVRSDGNKGILIREL